MQAEGDEVAAKLLATRRETMRLRNKIRELKQQHAQLRELKQTQQLQLVDAAAGMLQCCTLSQLPYIAKTDTEDCAQID